MTKEQPIGKAELVKTAVVRFLDAPSLLLYNDFVCGNGQAEPIGKDAV